MSLQQLILPQGYSSSLGVVDTEIAIKFVKDTFERELAAALQLVRVSAPFFVLPESGLNDDLNGVERAVSFDIKELGQDVQVVHSLAKWKRMALKRYGFTPGSGLYTDMNAIRRDEDLDNLHSVYVDQWDWEKVITSADRNLEMLQDTVRKLVQTLWITQQLLSQRFPSLPPLFDSQPEPYFITTQELADRYPGLTPKERENEIAREKGVVFLMGIGGKLADGSIHDGRAPDYDDWQLNGDILIWYPLLDRSVELSSMGIRVDAAALDRQLTLSGCDSRRKFTFHKMLLNDELPLTIGGGLGQSRICMVLLQKAHLGEVQASVWSQQMQDACEQAGIHLL